MVEQRWKEWVEEEAEKAARKAMNDSFLRDEGRDQARAAADAARKEVLKFHGELVERNDSDAKTPATQQEPIQIKEEPAPTVPKTKIPPDNESVAVVVPSAPKVSNGATAKTLAFTEKLRRMYEQKAAEKAAGLNGGSNVEVKTIQLADATVDVKKKETTHDHIPAPVVTPSPCMENILDDILSTQNEQPWLVQPDARVPSLGGHTDYIDTSQDMSTKQDKLSHTMRLELERKYKGSTSHGRYGKGRKGSNQSRFDEMIASRGKLPAFKMRNQVLEAIRNVSYFILS